MFRKNHLFITALLIAVFSSLSASSQAQFSWQEPHAKVLPQGDLKWNPKPLEFKTGDTVRYIDYENGNDNNDGTQASPWKHHPWDKSAKANAAAHRGVTTYVFKRGVTYRGALTAKESGKPGYGICPRVYPGTWDRK